MIEWNEEEVKLPDGTIKIKTWKIFTCKGCNKEYTLKDKSIDPFDISGPQYSFCDVDCGLRFANKKVITATL